MNCLKIDWDSVYDWSYSYLTAFILVQHEMAFPLLYNFQLNVCLNQEARRFVKHELLNQPCDVKIAVIGAKTVVIRGSNRPKDVNTVVNCWLNLLTVTSLLCVSQPDLAMLTPLLFVDQTDLAMSTPLFCVGHTDLVLLTPLLFVGQTDLAMSTPLLCVGYTDLAMLTQL